jgi:hypothetical protein
VCFAGFCFLWLSSFFRLKPKQFGLAILLTFSVRSTILLTHMNISLLQRPNLRISSVASLDLHSVQGAYRDDVCNIFPPSIQIYKRLILVKDRTSRFAPLRTRSHAGSWLEQPMSLDQNDRVSDTMLFGPDLGILMSVHEMDGSRVITKT